MEAYVPETVLEVLGNRLQNLNYKFIQDNGYCSKANRHEIIKSEIVQFGKEKGFMSIPEVNPCQAENGRRIDVVWFDEGEPRFGFEVDSSVKKKSMKKLGLMNELNDGFFCPVIVSMALRSKTIEKRKSERLRDEFSHIDAKVWEQWE